MNVRIRPIREAHAGQFISLCSSCMHTQHAVCGGLVISCGGVIAGIVFVIAIRKFIMHSSVRYVYVYRCWSVCVCVHSSLHGIVTPYVVAGRSYGCAPIKSAGESGVVLGVVSAIMGYLCCSCMKPMGVPKLIHAIWCALIWITLLWFFATVIASSAVVFSHLDFDATEFASCNAPALPLGLTAVSYVLLILFVLFCSYFTYTCLVKFEICTGTTEI